MKIANLDYIEVLASNEIVGGTGRRGNNFDFSKRLNIDIRERVDVYKRLDTYSKVYGNSAIAEADAEAYGPDSNAEGFSFTYTDPNSSIAGATSISQS